MASAMYEKKESSPGNDANINKQTLIFTLNKSYAYIERVEKLSDKQFRYETYKANKEGYIANAKKYTKHWRDLGIVVLVIGTVVGILYALGPGAFYGDGFPFSIFIPALLIAIAFFVLSIKNKGKIPALEQEIAKDQSVIDGMSAEFDLCNKEMIDEITCLQILLPSLLHPSTVQVAYLINALQSGRANDLKEALLLWDEHEHRKRMENYAAAQNEYARQTEVNSRVAVAIASRIADNAGRAADNAAVIAIYNRK